jgi:hypothetical protein
MVVGLQTAKKAMKGGTQAIQLEARRIVPREPASYSAPISERPTASQRPSPQSVRWVSGDECTLRRCLERAPYPPRSRRKQEATGQ